MATPLETGLTAEDIVALQLNPPPMEGVSRTTKPAGNATLDAVSAAIPKIAQPLQTNPIDTAAAIASANAASAAGQYRELAAQRKGEMAAVRQEQDSVAGNYTQEILREGELKTTIASGAQQIEDRNRGVLNENFKTKEELLAENAREQTELLKSLETENDLITSDTNAEGFVGFLRRTFVRPHRIDEANRLVSVINQRKDVQDAVIASTTNLTAHQIALMASKTPEQKAAELGLVQNASQQAAQKATLETLTSKQLYFQNTLQNAGHLAGIEASEAGRKMQESYARFNAANDAIKWAAEGASKVAALQQVKDSLFGEVNDSRRVEETFNLSQGEGANWLKRLEKANPEAYAAVLEVSYSGSTSNEAGLAQALKYSPPQQHTASMRLLADKVIAKEGEFSAFLQAKGTDPVNYKKLPSAEREAIRNEFNLTARGAIPTVLIDSTASSISKTIATNAPTGVIEVPAIIGKDGKVTRDARKIRLLPTGKLGAQLANLEGDATAAYELAKLAVTEDGRDPAEVAREYANFYQNALTVEGAYRGVERKMFGLPAATEFPSNIKEEGYLSGSETKVIDHASYPAVLTCLVKAKTAKLTQGVREGIAPMGVTSQMTGTEFVPGVK